MKPYDVRLALPIYNSAGAKAKVVQCLAEAGQFDKVVPYAKRVGYQPDWSYLLMTVINTQPQTALGFAQQLLAAEEGPLIDANMVLLYLTSC